MNGHLQHFVFIVVSGVGNVSGIPIRILVIKLSLL